MRVYEHCIILLQSGHQPCVRVYEHEDNQWNSVAEFSGHKFGISVVVSCLFVAIDLEDHNF